MAAREASRTLPPALRVATLNLRNTSDRWRERAPLLIEQFVELRPDVIGLQEVRITVRQAHWIAGQVNARLPADAPPYDVFITPKTGIEGAVEGIAIVTWLPFEELDRLDLKGGSRVAQRARLRLTSGRALDFYNAHLHHTREAASMRLDQARRILEWMDGHTGASRLLVGDLNAKPDEPPVRLIAERMRSAYAAVHGREPGATAPTPLSAEWGHGSHVIDYIFVDPDVEIRDARVTFDRVGASDPRLCASDHYGLAADLAVG